MRLRFYKGSVLRPTLNSIVVYIIQRDDAKALTLRGSFTLQIRLISFRRKIISFIFSYIFRSLPFNLIKPIFNL